VKYVESIVEMIFFAYFTLFYFIFLYFYTFFPAQHVRLGNAWRRHFDVDIVVVIAGNEEIVLNFVTASSRKTYSKDGGE